MYTKSDKILADYFHGAYGPTIRIEAYTSEQLLLIRNILTDLKVENVNEFQLSKCKFVEITGFNDLILKREKGRGLYNKLKVINNAKVGTDFLWLQTESGWENTEGLLDGLIESIGYGHQYLTEEKNEVLVELYKKYFE